jgi:hypothetical protein
MPVRVGSGPPPILILAGRFESVPHLFAASPISPLSLAEDNFRTLHIVCHRFGWLAREDFVKFRTSRRFSLVSSPCQTKLKPGQAARYDSKYRRSNGLTLGGYLVTPFSDQMSKRSRGIFSLRDCQKCGASALRMGNDPRPRGLVANIRRNPACRASPAPQGDQPDEIERADQAALTAAIAKSALLTNARHHRRTSAAGPGLQRLLRGRARS